jgi:hypothetical protein
VIVYHVTRAKYADSIDRDGFEDRTGRYLTSREHTGVFVSDLPLVIESGLEDPIVFEIDLPDADLAGREFIEDGSNHREWLVPAAALNAAHRRQVGWPECLDDIEARP